MPRLEPKQIQVFGNELAVAWSDGQETYLPLETVRRACPCATCKGEGDALYAASKPEITYDPPRAFTLRSWAFSGGYAWQPTWNDGHSTGLYAFDYLRGIGQREK